MGIIIGLGNGSGAAVATKAAAALTDALGLVDGIKAGELVSTIDGMPRPLIYPVEATTVRKSASATENVASNNLCMIHGNDGKAYTLAEWNALFVAAGYDKNNMTVEPDGFILTKNDGSREVIYWDAFFDSRVAQITGASLADDKSLQHSPYSVKVDFTATGSGTDTGSGKGWTITADGDEFVLYTANTKQSFRIKKGLSNGNAWVDSKDFEDRTEALYQITEWYRHRSAIDSGLSTTEADGTIAAVSILNASGAKAAAGEDMYFWIGGTNTNLLAKYNLTRNHDNTVIMNSTQQGTIYDAQKTNGINMNDTGVNSSTKPILADGAKGAEAVAVDGKWYIITPFITQPGTAAQTMADAPAVYWARKRGLSLPSTEMVDLWWWNRTLVTALRSYLVNTEGRTVFNPGAAAYWCAARGSAAGAWAVATGSGGRFNVSPCNRSRVCGASGFNG